MLKINSGIAYMLVFAICGDMLYFIFPFQPIVWRILIIALCALPFSTCVRVPRNPIVKWIAIFLALNLVYCIAQRGNRQFDLNTIGNTFVALMPFIALVRLAYCPGVLTKRWLYVSAILLTMCGIYYYQYTAAMLLAKIDARYITVNASVIFVMILPLCILIRNKIISLVIVCVCIFFLIAAVKRGNIVASIIPLILYLRELWKSTSKSFFTRALIFLVVVIIAAWAVDMMSTSEYFQQRLKDTKAGNSSYRDVIYAAMWNLWAVKASFVQFLFGYGYYGTIYYSGTGYFAHNDWLEILVDFGLVGAIIYLMIFFNFVRYSKRIARGPLRSALFALTAVWFAKTTYSMGFTDEYLCILAIPFGYIVSQSRAKRKKVSTPIVLPTLK